VTDEPTPSDADASKFTAWWVAKGERVDTDITPRWRRTGYRYFPYAACESGHAWVLRANYCFPAHDLCTLFIDGRAVADVTSGREDPRPLLASIGSLNPILPESLPEVPAMAPDLAKTIVDAVAKYVAHGVEWGDPCAWCLFAERDQRGADFQRLLLMVAPSSGDVGVDDGAPKPDQAGLQASP
jgi:hypothetical protein